MVMGLISLSGPPHHTLLFRPILTVQQRGSSLVDRTIFGSRYSVLSNDYSWEARFETIRQGVHTGDLCWTKMT